MHRYSTLSGGDKMPQNTTIKSGLAALFAMLLLSGCATVPPPAAPTDMAALKAEVIAVERAFAATMAARDHAAFTRFLAEETVFYTGGVLRGRQAVADYWKRFYQRPDAPFSWEPDPAEVQVLDSGTLALSTGPVRNPRGEVVATFTSIWRREAPGVWRIVFDKGNDVCQKCAAPATAP